MIHYLLHLNSMAFYLASLIKKQHFSILISQKNRGQVVWHRIFPALCYWLQLSVLAYFAALALLRYSFNWNVSALVIFIAASSLIAVLLYYCNKQRKQKQAPAIAC